MTIKLLTAACAIMLAALFVPVIPATVQAANLPCPENKSEIGAGTCPDKDAGAKRVMPKDSDKDSTEKAPPATEIAANENVGRDDKAAQEERARQRKARIDLLARDAEKPFK